MLINEKLANKKVATEFGEIVFNEKGECKDLTAEQAKVLCKLPGFSYKEAKKSAPKTATKKAAPKAAAKPKEEAKKEEK